MGRLRQVVLVWIVAHALVASVAAPAVAAAAPKPPSGVTATPVSGTEARISWQAARGATDYDVLRAPASAGPYSFVGNTTSPATAAVTSCSRRNNSVRSHRRPISGCGSLPSRRTGRSGSR